MRTDASDNAIGAVLEQEREGKWVPVAFFSRKLGGSQLNWTPREKETYAIVSSLRKWAGWIGFQPVLIKTDHRSLEDWVSEHVDTPSGPRGRRARWHETLSQFNLEVQYIPGKENIVADAMSRYAYPASSAREDVSFHGSAQARDEMKKIIEKEIQEGHLVGLAYLGGQSMGDGRYRQGCLQICGSSPTDLPMAPHVRIIPIHALNGDDEEIPSLSTYTPSDPKFSAQTVKGLSEGVKEHEKNLLGPNRSVTSEIHKKNIVQLNEGEFPVFTRSTAPTAFSAPIPLADGQEMGEPAEVENSDSLVTPDTKIFLGVTQEQ